MTGPVASLLLREPLSEAEIAELNGWLLKIGLVTQVQTSPAKKYSADFNFTYFPPLISSPENRSCSFLLEVINPATDEEFSFEESKRILFQARLGYVPSEIVLVSAMCNQPQDHRLLALSLIELAGKFGVDLIDMHGELQNRPHLQEIVIEIPSETRSNFILIIVDVEFMKAWLAHPNFHMVK